VKSILWGLLAAVVCGGAAVIMVKVLRLPHDGSPATFDRSPLWLVTLIMFRAGMVEELFYRGYAIERFRAMGLGKLVSAAIPLIIFAATHYRRSFECGDRPGHGRTPVGILSVAAGPCSLHVRPHAD
jgi:membrane protease YdiL (CAAX protease family)